MKREEIREHFESLANSQGFYGRLLDAIDNSDESTQEEFWADLENHNFKNIVEVIMYIEG